MKSLPGLVRHTTLLCAAISALAFAPAAKAWQSAAASLRIVSGAASESGMKLLDGADGVTEFTDRGGSPAVINRPDSRSGYLYFALNPQQSFTKPVYLRVEYYDGGLGTGMQCQYDSGYGDELSDKFRPAEDQAGGALLGTRKWRVAIFRCDKPRFQHRENLGADFRLSGGALAVRSVQLLDQKPADWAEADKIEAIDIKPLVKIGAGGQFIVGGFDPAKTADAAPQAHALETSMPALKSLGVTSHEGYVRWNLCEPSPGKYDWSVYDRFVALYKKHHIKWVPFLIIGSPYSLPDWYYKKPGSQGYVCLEHGQQSDVQSLWNPALKAHIARFVKAFCEHYKPTGVIESILLGVTGNYGEAIYPASGNDWTADIHGNYHTHAGMWAGDPYAVQDFRRWLKARYPSYAALSASWGSGAPASADVATPFLRKDAPSDRAWLDECSWYIGSMTSYARFWMHETRKNFPTGDIYLCTGGHAPAEHGSDFGEQCKVAAEVHGGVRITNEGSDERANFSLTRWVASAGRQYGAYFSFEPAGEVNPAGVVGRVFNASTSGAKGLHYYYPNLFASDAAREYFVKSGAAFTQHTPIIEAAVYYPETDILLHGNDFLGSVQALRSSLDFDYMSDGQIRDGGLSRIKVLILLKGNTSEASTWAKIKQWLRAGGIVIYADSIGSLRTVEGAPENMLTEDAGKGKVIRYAGSANGQEYGRFIASTLLAESGVGARFKAMLRASAGGVFASVDTGGRLTLYNHGDAALQADGAEVPPHTIVQRPVSDR
jgi:Glycosyl hydrolase family 14